MAERFYIRCLGCPKNNVDAEGIAVLLRQQGYHEVARPEQADILIVNTCGFIAPARRESLAALRELARRKRQGQLLIAAGCLVEREGARLQALVPDLDGIIGTHHWSQFAAFLEALKSRQPSSRGICYVWESTPQAGSLVASFPRRATTGASAYIKIADGCDATCNFCAIPLIKGRQQSKPEAEIIAEARELVAQGVKELVLIAQDTTAYGRDLGRVDGLPDLIERILEAVPDLLWLRILYAYPQHVSERLIRLMAERKQICHYLDLPLQHSHPDVLRRMGRSPDLNRVRALLADLRDAMPDISLRTSFIVGYPGETEAEFAHLLSFMEEVAFDKVGIFTYSREVGTAAAELPGQLSERVKEERFHRAMTLQQRLSMAQNAKQVGRVLDVLVEGYGDGISVGRSYRDAPEIDGLVILSGQHPVGHIVRARITQALEYDLVGEAVGPASAEEGLP